MWMGIVGGALIGLAAVWLFATLGRVAGISGIAASAMMQSKQAPWAVFFIAGLGVGGWLAYALVGFPDAAVMQFSQSDAGWFVVGGLLVGFGTRLGSGCTSGHGVCGISRFSLRSLTATIVFLGVGMLTATALHLV